MHKLRVNCVKFKLKKKLIKELKFTRQMMYFWLPLGIKYLYVYLYIAISSRSVILSPSPSQPHPVYLQKMVLGALFVTISPITNIYKKIKKKNLLAIVFYWLSDYLVFTTHRHLFYTLTTLTNKTLVLLVRVAHVWNRCLCYDISESSDTTVTIGLVFNTLYNNIPDYRCLEWWA